jgi:hypothetical protein
VSPRVCFIAAALGALAIGVTLWSWGQPLISRTGEVRLWVGSIWSGENSQQVADWYSLSHLVHGMLVALVARIPGRWPRFPVAFAIALATGVAWEIVEHTDLVLHRFRAATVYQGYVGDSVLNAVCDYLSASVARDSLVLTTLQLVHPVPAIAAWQDAINPRTHPQPAMP